MRVIHIPRPGAKWAIGIDPSLTGFAVAGWTPEKFWTERYRSKLRGVQRLVDISFWLIDRLDVMTEYDVGMICMEGYSFGAKSSREVLGELGGVIKVALYQALPEPACYPTLVPPPTLKKWTTGAGNCSKDQMMLGVYKKWGFDPPNNDEADAYALARLAAATLNPQIATLAYEKNVIERLHLWTESPKRET